LTPEKEYSMEKFMIVFLFMSFSSFAFAICPAFKAESSVKQAAATFAEMRGMTGGFALKASAGTFVSAQDEIHYRVFVSAGSLAGETYEVLVDINCRPSAIQLSSGLE
jgi:hypothetical protein